ncbi:hypothetical protein Zm00014a_038148 [Zea mays]|uniref:Uncharacterized protein n=2 Tax=Zea mays TaxID=4577 RepID=A0A1D6EUC8_MAIZE|nr:hypothetical protein ZEAMMB73_Zm00001d006278 [Zea mays]ONM23272.1 hypothetical protein ZEAMMB73_Zm00001d006281 [Zea mays]PWZ38992.1 hypothetical protein Zm00014a_038148 [Zea mays]
MAGWRPSPIGGTEPPTLWWQGLTMELKNALTTSSEASRLSKHIAYSITAASQGSVILPPSSPVNPNSSRDMLRSSPNTAVPRYASGTSNLVPSEEYTTQWPLTATGIDVPHEPSASFASVAVSRLLAMAAVACHFFAI